MKFLPFLFLFLAACSQQRLERLVTKTPDLPATRTAQAQRVLPKGTITAPAGANDYQRDAAYLANLIANYYPDKAKDQIGDDFEGRSEAFVKGAATITTDLDWRIHVQYYLAALKDGHTNVNVPFFEKGRPFYSLSLYESDSTTLEIIQVDSTIDPRLLGASVVTMNRHSPLDIYRAYNLFHSSEANYYRTLRHNRYDNLPSYLKALGLATDDTLRLVVRDTLGQLLTATLLPYPEWQARTIHREPVRFPFAKRQPEAFFTQFLPEFDAGYLQMNTTLDYVAMKPEIKGYVGFPFTGIAKSYLKKQAKKAGSEDFGAVLATFFRRAAADSLERVILDLRYNPGGDERLARQFIWYLTDRNDLQQGETYYRLDGLVEKLAPGDYKAHRAAFAKTQGTFPDPEQWVAADAELLNQGFWQGITDEDSRFRLDADVPKFTGEVYVLIGSQTFSAAPIFAATLQDNDLATVIGTPSGNRPSGPTGAARVKLPHTKTVISLSYIYIERAAVGPQDLDAIYPDIYTPVTIESFTAGRDPALEAALGIE